MPVESPERDRHMQVPVPEKLNLSVEGPERDRHMDKQMTSVGPSLVKFSVSLGCMGYVAFGNNAPGNILTEFYEPFWLVDIANFAILIHLIRAFQKVYAQPIFTSYENWLASKWPSTIFFNKVYTIRLPFTEASFRFTICKLVLRTLFYIITTTIAMALPFFNAILGLLGSIAFWPLTVYFLVNMYISQAKSKKGSNKWLTLQSLSLIALIVSLVSAVGFVADIVERLEHAKFFSVTF
ncbi:amino acid permease 8-like [Telopea speciosissima]|uniref:amino acid permease 8-like n=1 Tax=Telopea speciosissima TaxID=54955 RepID=UPI001CC825FF|nr:amino acid permease 8-like [Telopea speciosissima]